ncbi:DUF7482 domain-containing protein [Fodinibius salsisoli]|uniref:DUF7482 domain-containing protein n=1 Tax=Fodinibius salsisoli TaxID=2820877 RepID=A0ABT3PJY3_9BACT|nr:hypothetical protein [Fodinibius salsisoli]MCW9706246.1 hypothetical protein [Fodinibius salsisoli]
MKFFSVIFSIILLSAFTACEQEFVKDWDGQPQDMTAAMGVVPDSLQNMSLAPLVKGYYNGGDLYFIHTEASDSSVANMLTEMMGPKVVYMPKLAKIPDSLLADIYVFKNGIEGHGPFGYQPDIFGSVPGDPGYSPLRSIHLVRWNEEADPHELKTVAIVKQAESDGKLAIEEAGIVVNMPVLVWPGGHR